MNKMITKLKEDLEKETKVLKEQQYIVKTIEDNLHDEIYKETKLLNKVLKNNLIKIIEIIHKEGLVCSSIFNVETIWNDTIYKVSDGNYFVNIIAKDGKITTDYNGIDNDGGGKHLKEKANLLVYSLNLFADKEKLKYEDKI